ncbi:MAG: lipid II:glycine glycyltransferase FemX [Termitinemataceae bacterium]|nr:MAG: lipid II:glycine glycyltransferase FemX [Termitinemataceae bacterium]
MYLARLERLDLSAYKNADNFLQSSFWGEFKASATWKVLYFDALWYSSVDDAEDLTFLPLLVLCRSLAAGFGFAYIPWGPILPDYIAADDKAANAALRELACALKTILPANIAFLRVDPPWFWNEGEPKRNIIKPFIHAHADIQVPDTVVIDLMPTTDDILAQMKPKCRYNVKLGGKKVSVEQCAKQDLPVFYQIFLETAKRDGIAARGIEYFASLFDLSCKDFDVRLYLASCKDGENGGKSIPIAGIITIFYGGIATYLYGASSNICRNLMAPYALQWQAMRDAKECGCRHYDLFGIPPTDEKNHPMAGLYRFKTGFGGNIIHRPGSQDYPYKTIFTALFRFAESIRKKLRDRKKR